MKIASLLFFVLAGAGHAASPPSPHVRLETCERGARLVSPSVATPAADLTIFNPRPSRARVYWMDSSGSAIFYGIVEPGGSLVLHSYLDHVFRIDDNSAHCMTTFVVTERVDGITL